MVRAQRSAWTDVELHLLSIARGRSATLYRSPSASITRRTSPPPRWTAERDPGPPHPAARPVRHRPPPRRDVASHPRRRAASNGLAQAPPDLHQEKYLTSVAPVKSCSTVRGYGSPGRASCRVSRFPMQPWLDVDEGGWSVVAATDGKPALADRIVEELADLACSLGNQFRSARRSRSPPPPHPPRTAPELADLCDHGYSVFGGFAGDFTPIVTELLGWAWPSLSPCFGGYRRSAAIGTAGGEHADQGPWLHRWPGPTAASRGLTTPDPPQIRDPRPSGPTGPSKSSSPFSQSVWRMIWLTRWHRTARRPPFAAIWLMYCPSDSSSPRSRSNPRCAAPPWAQSRTR